MSGITAPPRRDSYYTFPNAFDKVKNAYGWLYYYEEGEEDWANYGKIRCLTRDYYGEELKFFAEAVNDIKPFKNTQNYEMGDFAKAERVYFDIRHSNVPHPRHGTRWAVNIKRTRDSEEQARGTEIDANDRLEKF